MTECEVEVTENARMMAHEDEEDDEEYVQSFDFYKKISTCTELRPIMVTEGVHHSTLSQKLLWLVGTVIQMLSLIWLSVRTDRFAEPRYLRRHWKHYSMMLVITVLGWTPIIWNYFQPFHLQPTTSYAICALCLFYYPVSMTVFMWLLAPWMRRKYDKASTLKFWELFISVAWQIQTVGFTALTLVERQPFADTFKHFPTSAAKTIGYLMIAAGFLCKGAAIWMTGYNTYYWYDMVLEIPNAYFVNGGIYKFLGSPTYTVGRFTGFGAAVALKSAPLFIASIVELILITLYNYCVEQKFVEKTYKQGILSS